eukprot:2896779-Amphidinium_carterae.1
MPAIGLSNGIIELTCRACGARSGSFEGRLGAIRARSACSPALRAKIPRKTHHVIPRHPIDHEVS